MFAALPLMSHSAMSIAAWRQAAAALDAAGPRARQLEELLPHFAVAERIHAVNDLAEA
jgi:hypothetical protein